MVLILLEALGALLLLVLIVWWTMFSGRKNGEPPADVAPGDRSGADAAAAPDDGARAPAEPPSRR